MESARKKRSGGILPKFAMLAAGMSLTQWLKVLLESGGIERKHWLRALWISTLTIAYAPLRFLEQVKFGKKIRNTEIKHPPIFIIGHWRSGTSYLHRLIAQDKNLGYASAIQISFNSEFYLTTDRFIKALVGDQLYSEAAAAPLEDEYAILHASPYSYYLGLYFPRRTYDLFKKFVLFERVDKQTRKRWKQVYLRILKKLTFSSNGKRLVLKNPMNTGRINLLLEMFPDAKFIHIYRNPYSVYCSLRRLHTSKAHTNFMQSFSDEEREDVIISMYRELMQSYLIQKEAIPSGNLVELKYEYFVNNQMEELERIYEELGLPAFSQAKEAFKTLVDNEKKIDRSRGYELSEKNIERIRQHWQFAFDEWGYELPESIQVTK